jgi:hypothetical protein
MSHDLDPLQRILRQKEQKKYERMAQAFMVAVGSIGTGILVHFGWYGSAAFAGLITIWFMIPAEQF